MMKQYDYLIVGAGLFGSVFAREANLNGKKCLIIDKRSHSGGNIFCKDTNGIQVHHYGAHIFHTSMKHIWEYIDQFVEFNRFVNSPLAYYKGKIYNLPFNMNTFNKLWGVITPEEAQAKIQEQCKQYAHLKPQNLEEQALKLCGEDIYKILIKGYTEKQWGRLATELPAFIIQRIPFRFTYDNNYFNDLYQGIPIGGYNQLTNALQKDIEVRLNTNYFENKEYFDQLADKILFTGCLDEYFNYEFGHLEYRSLKFEHQLLECKDFQGNAVVNYTDYEIPYTRIIESKHFDFGKQDFTVITREYPQEYEAGREPYYPVNNHRNTEIARQYKEKALRLPHLLLGGRLGQYAYFDMDDTVEVALTLAKQEFHT